MSFDRTERSFEVTRRRISRRGWGVIALATVVLVAFPSCGGGGGGGTGSGGGRPAYTASATTTAQNLVTLAGAPVTDNQLELDVNYTGPTTETVCGFAFDLLLANGAVVQQVLSSAAGGSLPTAGGGSWSAQAAKSGTQRITVGVSKMGGTCETFAAGTTRIATILIRTQTGSSTIKFVGAAPSTSSSDAAACGADACAGGKLTSINFDSLTGTITQP
jgi:hypothetical protein